MYMANARNLCLVPNATYIPLTRVENFVSPNAKDTNMLVSFALGDAKVPNAYGFAPHWNICFSFIREVYETSLALSFLLNYFPIYPVLHFKFSLMIHYSSISEPRPMCKWAYPCINRPFTWSPGADRGGTRVVDPLLTPQTPYIHLTHPQTNP